jgi:hypothetical protein
VSVLPQPVTLATLAASVPAMAPAIAPSLGTVFLLLDSCSLRNQTMRIVREPDVKVPFSGEGRLQGGGG